MPPEPAADADALARLMARAQDGDRAAYAALLAAVVPALRARCRRAIFDVGEAEDALQDILLTLHRMRHAYDPARPFRPWLAALAQARIADRQRAAVRRARREADLSPAHETLAAPEANPDTLDHDRLREAVARLPEAERRAVRLLKLEELSLTEASARTGLSATALKVACHRALRRLRAMLDPAT
jgi:RNA polymerase sigma-70 factor (ECF subfamily)